VTNPNSICVSRENLLRSLHISPRNAVALAPTTRYDEPRCRISLQVSNDELQRRSERRGYARLCHHVRLATSVCSASHPYETNTCTTLMRPLRVEICLEQFCLPTEKKSVLFWEYRGMIVILRSGVCGAEGRRQKVLYARAYSCYLLISYHGRCTLGSKLGSDVCATVLGYSGTRALRPPCRLRGPRPQQAPGCLLSPNIHLVLNCTLHTPHVAFRTMASASTSRDPDVEAQRDALQPHRASHHLARYYPVG
jgi:hypothetical protein